MNDFKWIVLTDRDAEAVILNVDSIECYSRAIDAVTNKHMDQTFILFRSGKTFTALEDLNEVSGILDYFRYTNPSRALQDWECKRKEKNAKATEKKESEEKMEFAVG